MPDEPVPEADAQDQAEEVDELEVPEIEDVRIPPDVPEADALEQVLPAAYVGTDRPRIRPDVPEADALEQSQTVTVEEDDFR
jgi:hypothetical protein